MYLQHTIIKEVSEEGGERDLCVCLKKIMLKTRIIKDRDSLAGAPKKWPHDLSLTEPPVAPDHYFLDALLL